MHKTKFQYWKIVQAGWYFLLFGEENFKWFYLHEAPADEGSYNKVEKYGVSTDELGKDLV